MQVGPKKKISWILMLMSILGVILIAVAIYLSSKLIANQKNTQKNLAQDDKVASNSSVLNRRYDFKVQDLEVGTEDEVEVGDQVVLSYRCFFPDGRIVETSEDVEEPLTFVVGTGDVIKGLDMGVVGMKLGGKRGIVIPPEYAYGEAGSPPEIPPNSTLIFEVKLDGIKKAGW